MGLKFEKIPEILVTNSIYFGNFLETRLQLFRVFGFDLIPLTSKMNRDEVYKPQLSFIVDQQIQVSEDINILGLTSTS